jgi:hypothetical protein
MSGCGVFLLILLFIAILSIVNFISPSDKKVTNSFIVVAVGFLVILFSSQSCKTNSIEQKAQEVAAKSNEIELLKRQIEVSGYLGLSERQLESVYGDPILQNKISDGVWNLTYSFGTVTVKNGTVVSAPVAGKKNVNKNASVQSIKLKNGTVRKNMTSDEFVAIVKPYDVTSQSSEPDLSIPDSLVVHKFCRVDGKEFQVRLARKSYNGPYRITNIWTENSTSKK